jgi:rubrerythrin
MSKSEENLKAAFAGESQANRKYTAFAEKAGREGYPQIAKLFRAAAAAETVHALKHLRTLGGVQSTLENLKEAREGENYEATEMYPKFIQEAQEEGNKAAQTSFEWAIEAEKTHRALYDQAIQALEKGKDLEPVDLYICKVCGWTTTGSPPDQCPVCKALAKAFEKIT